MHLRRWAALASQLCQLSVAVQDVYSSSSTFFIAELLNESTGCAANKKPLHLRGSSAIAFPLILRYTPPELAPFMRLCKWVAGLQRAVTLHLSG